MKVIKQYINLNNCLIDLQNNQKHLNEQAGRCDDYYHCVQQNVHLVEQYKRLSTEISRDFVKQHFDIDTLSHNFNRLETIDSKIRDLQHAMPEIRKYMKSESENIESGMKQMANDLNFELMEEAEEWIDGILYELAEIKQERYEKMEQWKSAGKAVVKNTASAIGTVSSFLWRTINK